MVGLPRLSDIVVSTPTGLFSARYTRSSRPGIRRPSTLMIWTCGSTRAPYLRTISPSTSTLPSPIISSQCRRVPRAADAGRGEHLLQPHPAGDVDQRVVLPVGQVKVGNGSGGGRRALRSAARRTAAAGRAASTALATVGT